MNHTRKKINYSGKALLFVLSAIVSIHIHAQVYNDGILYIGSGCNVNLAGSMTNSTSANVYVDGVLNMNNNSVTFKSSASGTGILNKVTGTVENYGNVTVERYIPARRAFRFFAPAVNTNTSILNNWQEGSNVTGAYNYPNAGGTATNPNSGFGTHITGSTTGANGFDATQTGDASLYTFNTATQSWQAVANTNSTTISACVGYRMLVRGDRSVNLTTNTPVPTNTIIRTTGRMIVGDTTLSAATGGAGAYIFAANPYQCPVALSNTNATNLTSTISFWDPTLGTRGAFVTYNLATMISGNGTSAVSNVLQPGQAVMLQKNTAATASYQFKENDKVSTLTNSVFRTTALPRLEVRLYQQDTLLNNGPTADAFTTVFDNSFSNDIDDNDSKKLNNLDETISVMRNGIALAIEARQVPVQNDTIQMNITQYRSAAYTFVIDLSGISVPGLQAVLEDRYLNTQTSLPWSMATRVNFQVNNSIAATKAANRFYIIFKNAGVLSAGDIRVSAQQVADQSARIHWEINNESDVRAYQVEKSNDGRIFSMLGSVPSSQQGNYAFNDARFNATAYYRVVAQLKDGASRISNTVVLKKDAADDHRFVLYPNPVKAQSVNLLLSNLPQGNYQVNIYNSMGQLVMQKNIDHRVISASYYIQLNNMSAGIYQVTVQGNERVFTKQLTIF